MAGRGQGRHHRRRPQLGVALAVNDIVREKNKVFLNSGAGTSDLTGKACTPNTVHWTYDTWALANGTGKQSCRPAATPGSSSLTTTPSGRRLNGTPPAW